LDDYSKSGPKTPRAAAKAREAEMQARMKRLLAIETEGEFIDQLRIEAGIGAKHPNFLTILKLWRDLRP
jgi:hypothetical protein